MAEIHVEKKKRSIWPWLLLLVLIAVVVWAAITFYGDKLGLRTSAPAAAPVLALSGPGA